MDQTYSVQLSTNELAAALALCGYEGVASGIILNIENRNNGEETVNRFIEYTEATLKGKGYLDGSRSTLLIPKVENLIYLLMSSTRKIRCVKGNHILFIHFIDPESIVIQEIKNQIHYFTKQKTNQDFIPVLKKQYKLNNISNISLEKIKTMQLSEDLYNELHNLDPLFLEHMISDEELDADLRGFLNDFKNNSQQFDNLSFMEMDYIRDKMDFKQVIFLLPSRKYLWHLDYDNILKKEVYIIPSEIDQYLNELNQSIVNFFELLNHQI